MNEDNKNNNILSRLRSFDHKTDDVLFQVAKIALPLGILYALYIIIFGK